MQIVRSGCERYAAAGEFTDDIVTADFVWDMSNFHGCPERQVYEGAEGGVNLPQGMGGMRGTTGYSS